MRLQFKGLIAPIAFDNCPELVPILHSVLRGWHKITPHDSAPCITLKPGYTRTSKWLDKPVTLNDPVDAVCDLLLDIEKARMAGSTDALALHAAAVEFAKGLVVFPSTYKAGKSVLSVHLAQAGLRVFSDDQLPLSQGVTHGIAPGYHPRLRQPLRDLAPDLGAFIDSHAGPSSESFQYVDLPKDTLAPLGQKAEIQAIVLLERRIDAAPALTPIPDSEILKHSLVEGMNRTLSALETLDHMHALVKRTQGFRLTYADSRDAVALLQETFS